MGTIITESATIITSDESLAKNQKEEEYMNYIKDHINNVYIAFNNLFLSRLNQFEINSEYFTSDSLYQAIEDLNKGRIQDHDLSKYSEEEFEPYRAKYYPTEKEISGLTDEAKSSIEKNADIAWQHHYNTNPHHPNYWIDKETGNPIDMDLISIVEMICDWEAMSMKFGGSTVDWYDTKADKEKKAMTDRTKNIVEELLNILYKK